METSVDAAGRIFIPKVMRDALGLTPGTTLDISRYGAGLHVVVGGRIARLVEDDGVLVATGDTVIDDDLVFELIDAERR